MGKKIEFYRFKIIEPFLKKEKKLKEIEEKHNISYATLKRWVQAYKKNGILGLEKKTREDKDSFRNINNSHLEKIEKLCAQTNETNITKLYKHYVGKLTNDLTISYATFYRIVNNIDSFFNKDTVVYLDKIKKEHQCYALLDIPLYIFVSEDTDSKLVPHLLIIIDVASLKPIHFMLKNSSINFYEILSFIREVLLKIYLKTDKKIFPQDILVASQELTNKHLLKSIHQQLGIKIYEHYTENSEIQKFIGFLKRDLQIFYDKNNSQLKSEELASFITKYLYLQDNDYAFSLNLSNFENTPFLRKFDIFLQETTRKVKDSKVRVKNLQYTSQYFDGMNGQTVTIKYSSLEDRIIYIFYHGKYLFLGYLINKS